MKRYREYLIEQVALALKNAGGLLLIALALAATGGILYLLCLVLGALGPLIFLGLVWIAASAHQRMRSDRGRNPPQLVAILMAACCLTVAVGSAVAAGPAKKKPVAPDIVATVTPGNFSRNIQYNENDIPTIRTKVGYTTSLSLPDGEVIMGAISGDTELWKTEVPPGSNLSFIRPGKAGISTNLNLVTASNHVYPFLLVEGGGQPDLKVVMKVGNSMVKEINSPSKWVARTELEAFRKEVEEAKKELERTKAESMKDLATLQAKADGQIADFRSKFPASLKFDYVYSKGWRNNFGVQAMAHGDAFTYIYANPQETPVLYEVRDGKPTVIDFQFENGVYIAGKVLDKGYLQIGKHKMNFKREE